MREDRLPLATLCNYQGIVVTVVGTWEFTRASGEPGTVETRKRKFGSNPQTDETAHGYLLLPSNGTSFILEPFGAVALGELTPLF